MVEKKPADPVASALDTLKPILSKLTFGGFMGFCSGYASKKVGKAVAVTVGMGFMALQGLVMLGYIEIDWMKVKDDAIKSIDTVCQRKTKHEALVMLLRRVVETYSRL